jgi:hypothetical protein
MPNAIHTHMSDERKRRAFRLDRMRAIHRAVTKRGSRVERASRTREYMRFDHWCLAWEGQWDKLETHELHLVSAQRDWLPGNVRLEWRPEHKPIGLIPGPFDGLLQRGDKDCHKVTRNSSQSDTNCQSEPLAKTAEDWVSELTA